MKHLIIYAFLLFGCLTFSSFRYYRCYIDYECVFQPIARFQGQATDVELMRKEVRNVKAELVKLTDWFFHLCPRYSIEHNGSVFYEVCLFNCYDVPMCPYQRDLNNLFNDIFWANTELNSHSSHFLFMCGIIYILISRTAYLFWKVKLYAKHIGKSPEEIEADIRRPKYFSPSEAVEYGIIDKVQSPFCLIMHILYHFSSAYNYNLSFEGSVQWED